MYIHIYPPTPASAARQNRWFILFLPILQMPPKRYTLTTPKPAQTAPIPDSQILRFSGFSKGLLDPDYPYRGQSARSRPG